MKQTITLTVVSIFIFNQLTAQSLGNDSKGKDIFNFYATKAITTTISSTANSLKLGYNIPIKTESDGKGVNGKQYYVERKYRLLDSNADTTNLDYRVEKGLLSKNLYAVDSSHFTVAYSQSLNVSASAGNLGTDFSNLSTFHPSWAFSVGFSINIDSFNNWDAIKTLKRSWANLLVTYSFTGYVNVNNLLLYDSVAQKMPRNHPATWGVTAEGTLFQHYTRFFCLSGSLTYERGKQLSDLKNFQLNTPTYEDGNAISLGDVVGKIGNSEFLNSVRFRLSVPLFIDALRTHKQIDRDHFFSKITHWCLIPYYAVQGIENTKPSTNAGVFLNILGGKFGYKHTTIIPGGGFGIDWIRSANGWSKRHIFVSGSFNIPSYFRHQVNGSKSISE